MSKLSETSTARDRTRASHARNVARRATASPQPRSASADATTRAIAIDRRTAGVKLKRFRKELGLTCQQLAEKIGYTRPYVSAVENGSYPLTDKLVRHVSAAFDIEASFLLADTGTPETSRGSRGPVVDDASVEALAADFGFSAGADDLPDIPLLEDVRGGPLCEVPVAKTAADARAHLPRGSSARVRDRGCYALRVVGDSMAPRLFEGDVIVVSPVAPVHSGAIVVAQLDGEATVKCFHPMDDGQVALVPVNPRHRPIFCALEALDRCEAVVEIRPALEPASHVGREATAVAA